MKKTRLFLLITGLTCILLTGFFQVAQLKLSGGASYWGYVDPDYVLPMTGVGADYLWYSNADLSIWTQTTFNKSGVTYYGHIDLVNFWKPLFHITQLGICFTSASARTASWYDQTKFGQVLALFGERNAPIIVAHYPAWNTIAHCGSQALWNNWIQFVEDWKGDSRIAAIKLYGQPVGAVDNGQGTDTVSWVPTMTRKDIAVWFAKGQVSTWERCWFQTYTGRW